MSANWRRGHPWAAVYDFFVERESLSGPAGKLLFGTETGLLYERMRAVDDVPDGGAVLDIPCGGGVALRALSPARRLRYVAADIAPAMLDRTREVAARRGLDQVETAAADVEDMQFADGEFDLCMSFAGLHCFPHPDRAVREIARVLKRRGRFVGSVFLVDGSIRYLPMVVLGRAAGVMGPSGGMGDLRRWFDEAGFADAHVERSGAIAYFDATR